MASPHCGESWGAATPFTLGLTTPKRLSPAWVSSQDYRLQHLTVYLACAHGCLTIISNGTCPKTGSDFCPTVRLAVLLQLSGRQFRLLSSQAKTCEPSLPAAFLPCPASFRNHCCLISERSPESSPPPTLTLQQSLASHLWGLPTAS